MPAVIWNTPGSRAFWDWMETNVILHCAQLLLQDTSQDACL